MESYLLGLEHAILHNDIMKIALYLSKVDFRQNPHFNRVLYTAVLNQRYDVISLLLEHGSDPNYRMGAFDPLLSHIVREDIPMLLRYVLNHGINIEATGCLGRTPLLEAILYDQPANVDILLQYSANPNIQDSQGETALMYAVNKGNISMIQSLIGYGADINICDYNNNSAIVLASRHKDGEIRQVFGM